MVFVTRPCIKGQDIEINLIEFVETDGDDNFQRNTLLPCLSATIDEPEGGYTSVTWLAGTTTFVENNNGDDFSTQPAIVTPDGLTTFGWSANDDSSTWTFCIGIDSEPMETTPFATPDFTGDTSLRLNVPSIFGTDNVSAFLAKSAVDMEFYMLDGNADDLISYDAFTMSLAEGQDYIDVAGAIPVLNDGISYYYWIIGPTTNKIQLIIFTPQPFGSGFVNDNYIIEFDDPAIEDNILWGYAGADNDFVYFRVRDLDDYTFVRIAKNGLTYDVIFWPDDGILFPSTFWSGGVGQPIYLGAETLIGASIFLADPIIPPPTATVSGNVSLGEPIRLGCWSPCPNVSLYRE